MKKKTLEQFVEQSRLKYNNLFDYSLAEYNGINKPIILICANNHTFQTLPITHLSVNSKGGCRECYNLNLYNNRKYKYTQSTFIEACNKIHNNRYDYTKIIYKMIENKIIISEKIKLLQNMGYNVVYIWENNWRKGIKVVKKIQRIWRKSKQV